MHTHEDPCSLAIICVSTTNSSLESYPRKFTTLPRTPLSRVSIKQSPIMRGAGDTHAYSRNRNPTESTSHSRNGNNSSTPVSYMPPGHRSSGRKRPLDSDGEDDTRGKRNHVHTNDRQKEKITVMNNISEPRFEECHYNVWNRGTPHWFSRSELTNRVYRPPATLRHRPVPPATPVRWSLR